MLKNIFLLIIIICSFGYGQTIHDLIQPINLLQDQSTKVLISDIFYSDNYNVEFTSTKNINVGYDKSTNEVLFTPSKNFSGMDLVPFELNGEIFQIPVKLTKNQKYLFTYKPEFGENQVNLFGQFNSWDRQSLPMKDTNGRWCS